MEPVKPFCTPAAYRRQRQIEQCLFENLLHTPYPSISVSDLCRQVGISRKAFYNYFHDKEACLCSLIYSILEESMVHTAVSIPDNATALDVCTTLLDYWKENRVFLDIIVSNDLLNYVMQQGIHYVLNEDKTVLDLMNTPEIKSDADILCCYMSSQITLILQWHSRNFDTPTEVMARKYLRLMYTPMIPLPGEE